MKKKKNKDCCSEFSDGKLPPCASYIGSINPLIVDGKLVYRNYNRLYFFLSFSRVPEPVPEYNPLDTSTYINASNGNLQIDPYYFFIGMYINEVEKGTLGQHKDIKIHDDENADSFIKKVLENQNKISCKFIPSLTYVISNSNAVISVYNGNIRISPINYYIILMLSRFYGDYGMLFSDNAYITPDFINYELANTFISFDC